jgi:pimeloyl-ACP methyl ester carboxylesterase
MSARTGRQPVVAAAPAGVCPAPPQVATPSMCGSAAVALCMRELELPSGVRLPFVEQGDRFGIPVLLVHGYTDSWRSFEGVLPYLPNWVRALALTLRGHGNAGRPDEGYRPADFAADLAAFMDHLGVGPAIVVGHSMGSYVAQRFALDYPERALGLVLIGSFTTVRGNPAVVDLWASAVSKLLDPIDPDFVAEFQRSAGAASTADVPRHDCRGEPEGAGAGVASCAPGHVRGRSLGRAAKDQGARPDPLGRSR